VKLPHEGLIPGTVANADVSISRPISVSTASTGLQAKVEFMKIKTKAKV
jgi:hypothetical protein